MTSFLDGLDGLVAQMEMQQPALLDVSVGGFQMSDLRKGAFRMMGMVYTELLDMIETEFSFDMVDAVIERAGVSGTYTSVGNYSDDELFALVNALSELTDEPVPILLKAYGAHLGARFVEFFPSFLRPIHPLWTF